MNNKLTSQLLRALKVSTSYLMVFILFVVFSMPVLSIVKDNAEGAMSIFSFVLFLILFYSVYVEMRTMAFKEKRPQYNINPPPYKGFFYGLVGIIPLIAVQLALILVNVPEDLITLKRRIYQGFGGPLYWISKLMGDDPLHYIASFSVLILIAGLGYYAGHKEFYIVSVIRRKLGIKPSNKKNKR